MPRPAGPAQWRGGGARPEPAFLPVARARGVVYPSPMQKLSRRRFAATAGILAAALPRALHGLAPVPMRAAVIGHTGRGGYGHGLEGIFQNRAGVKLVALADPDPAGRTAMAAKLGVRAYADWREMLARERPQLVSLAMRHADQHHEIGLGVLRAGAHLHCEKPFTRSPAEADELLAEAGRRGLKIAVAHTMRMAPVILRLRQAVREGLLGVVRELRAHGKQDARAGGEELMVLGTHLFDFLRLFAGDPLSVSARVLQDGRDIRTADRRLVQDNVGWVAGDQVFATFAFPDGVNATFVSDGRMRETAGPWGLELRGTKGVARIHCNLEPNVFVRERGAASAAGGADTWTPFGADAARNPPPHHLAPVDDWLAAIREGREPECSGRNAAWAVEMVMGVYHAALTGRRVPFPLTERGHPLEG